MRAILVLMAVVTLLMADLALGQTNPIIVSKTYSSTLSFGELHVECPNGLKMISGGGTILPSGNLVGSYYSSLMSNWNAKGYQAGGFEHLNVYGICGNVDDLQVVQNFKSDNNNNDRLTASCPAGKKVLGGGAATDDRMAILTGSFPVGDNTWAAVGHHPTGAKLSLRVYAVCGTVAGYQQISQVNVKTPSRKPLTVSCPAGKKLIGGGAEAPPYRYPYESVLTGTFPQNDTTWSAIAHGTLIDPVLSAYAICAN